MPQFAGFRSRVRRSLLVAACSLVVALPTFVRAQGLFTPEDVARLQTVVQAKISPDGERVAYLLSVPRRPFKGEDGPAWTELHVADRSGQSRPFITGEVNISAISWTPDGAGISFLAKRGDDKHKSLYVIPVNGGESRRVLAHETDIQAYTWHPGGEQVAFTATEPEPAKQKELEKKGFKQEVYEEDQQPVKVWVAAIPPEEPAEPEQEEQKPRTLSLDGSASEIHWSPRRDLLAVALAPTPSVDDAFMNRAVHVVDAADGKPTARYEPPGKMGGFAWSPDGKQLAVITSADRSDPSPGRLVAVAVTGGESRDLLPSFEGHVHDVAWRDAQTVLYLADVGTSSTLGTVGVDGSVHRTLIAPEKGLVLRTLDRARQVPAIAFLSDSAAHPAEVFLSPAEDAAPKRLTDSNPWLAGMRFAPQEVITYEARDGLRLEGVLIRPLDEQEGQRYPLIVSVHGGPESHISHGWLTSYSNPGQVAAARGMAVFYPNYRASTGRGVEFSKLDHGDPAGKEFDDLVDGVDHLIEAGLADKDKVGITGGSYGGYASAWGATYYSERFAASVMFVGISNAVSKVGTTDIPEEMYHVHHRYRLWENWKLFLERSPVYYVEKARTPTLILHGNDDTRVHPSQSLELYRLLKLLGKAPVRFVRYPGEGHGNRRAASRYDYNLRMLRWMEHYLKGPGGAPPPADVEYPLRPKKEAEEKAETKPA